MSEKKDVRIYINSVRYEVEMSLFAEEIDEPLSVISSENGENEPERTQIKTVGIFEVTDDGRVEISYDETELTGMEGSRTVISFWMRDPHIITILRTGTVSTMLVFEKDKRHHCSYTTPYMPFEVCVRTFDVKNCIDGDGTLSIDYIVEIRGARAERTKFSMRIMDQG